MITNYVYPDIKLSSWSWRYGGWGQLMYKDHTKSDSTHNWSDFDAYHLTQKPTDPNCRELRWKANILNCVYWKSDSLLYWTISHTHLTYAASVVSPIETGILKDFVCEMYDFT